MYNIREIIKKQEMKKKGIQELDILPLELRLFKGDKELKADLPRLVLLKRKNIRYIAMDFGKAYLLFEAYNFEGK
jgi:hypothetical protein